MKATEGRPQSGHGAFRELMMAMTTVLLLMQRMLQVPNMAVLQMRRVDVSERSKRTSENQETGTRGGERRNGLRGRMRNRMRQRHWPGVEARAHNEGVAVLLAPKQDPEPAKRSHNLSPPRVPLRWLVDGEATVRHGVVRVLAMTVAPWEGGRAMQ